MPTYRTTARNQFRSPSGAVGEAPDGPGAMATMLDDVDNYLGVGGAEYVANAAGLAAIPSSRRFEGKLAYTADTKTTYRYVGVGNTSLQGNDTTHPWQAWHRQARLWAPGIASGYTGAVTVTGTSQISAGRLFLDLFVQGGTGFAFASGEFTITLGGNEVTIGQTGVGSGFYQPAGNSGAGSVVPLITYVAGAGQGVLANQIRVRVPRVNSATSPQNPVTMTPFQAFGAGSATDSFAISVSCPSALVA